MPSESIEITVSSPFPIFVGITGKRKLAEDPEQAETLEKSVRERLAATFDHIEALLPNTRKVLLTGMAVGVDLIAAKEVLRLDDKSHPRKNWLVLGALPFEEALYREDFTAAEWLAYQEVAADPRTRRWILPPLEARPGVRASSGELARRSSAEEGSDLRRKHYEQSGFWIANTANILIGVMGAGEKGDKIGGTARVVAHRRGLFPDAIAAEVHAASEILVPHNDLKRPSSGFVWLVDPGCDEKIDNVPVRVLPPCIDGELAQPTDEKAERTQRQLLSESMTLIDRTRRLEKSRSFAGQGAASLSSWPEKEDPAIALADISEELRKPAHEAAGLSRVVFGLLATLFLISFVTFEVFAKFLPNWPLVLAIYTLLLLGTFSIYLLARWREWQPISEDRRAVREALRVQLAWWRAGLRDRVDHHFLVGVDRDLARVREATRNLIAMAQLSCRKTASRIDWKTVFDPDDRRPFSLQMPISEHPRDWVGNQLYYFRQRKLQREAKGRFSDSLSWILFVTSAWLSALLAASLYWPNPLTYLLHPTQAWVSRLAWIGVIAGVAISSAVWRWFTATHQAHHHHELRAIFAIALGLPGALGLLLATQSLALVALPKDGGLIPLWISAGIAAAYGVFWLIWVLPKENETHPDKTILASGSVVLIVLVTLGVASQFSTHFQEGSKNGDPIVNDLAEYMTILVVGFLPAMAGTIRFLSEKFAVEAEALSYRDARVWFERADRLLARLCIGQEKTEDDERARSIIRQLGILALGESQEWLKSRRERPLSPMIGG